MKVGLRYACLSAAVATVLYGESAVRADNLIWDPGQTATATGSDNSGLWDMTSPIWYDPTTGTDVTFGADVNASNPTPDSVTFGTGTTGVGSATNTITLNQPITVQNITLGSAVNPVGGSTNGAYYTIQDNFDSGEPLTLDGNVTKTTNVGGVQFFLSSNVTLSSGMHTFALNDTSGDGAPELLINNAGFTGTGGITLDNGSYGAFGTLALNSAGDYSGGTTINSGRLVITTAQALGSGAVTINNAGALSIGNGNYGFSKNIGSQTIANAITITRNTYTGTNFGDYTDALISANTGNAGAVMTLSGPLTIDSTDARVSANTSTINITQPLVVGADVAPGTAQFTADGDFAGFINLQADNTAFGAAGGTINIMGGVELGATSEANIGGVGSKLTLTGGTFHPVGGFITDFSTHVINNGTGPTALGTLNGGVDIDAGKVFNASGLYGVALGSRGTGTLNFNGTNVFSGTPFFDAGTVNVNGSTTFGSFRIRSAAVDIGSGATVTTTNSFTDIGSDSPDNGTVNLTGTGQLIAGSGDFNVSDNANTKGTLNIGDSSVFTSAGHIYVAKSAGSVASIVQTGGTVTDNATGQFALALGSSSNTNTVPGSVSSYTKTGGTLTVAGETYVGSQGGSTGTFSQSAGATTINSWFVVGRQGGVGTLNVTGGTFTKQGGGNAYVGENAAAGASTVTVSNTGAFSDNAEFWVGENTGGVGVLNVGTAAGMATNADSAASFTNNSWLAIGRNGGNGTLNLYGGTVTQATANYFDVAGDGGNSTGTVNVYGGTLNAYKTYLGENGGGTAVLNISGGNVNLSTSGTGVIFANANTATGLINLNGGTLTATAFTANNGGGTGSATFDFNGGTLLSSADAATFIGAKVSSIVSAGGAKISPNGHAITISSALKHDATLSTTPDGGLAVSGTANGTLTLAGVNTYTGPTSVTGTANLALASTGSISTTTLNSTTAIANAGTISESGGGSIDSITGAGTLNVTGGTLALSNPTFGTLNTQSAINLTGSGVLDLKKNQIQVNGNQYNTLVSAFKAGSLTSSSITTGRTIGINYNGTTTLARYTLAGDADLDGSVSINDFNTLAANFGTPSGATWAQGDFDYDGSVSINDFNALAANFGQTLPAADGGQLNAVEWAPLVAFAEAHNDLTAFQAATGVPEPTSLAVLGVAAAFGLRRRRAV